MPASFGDFFLYLPLAGGGLFMAVLLFVTFEEHRLARKHPPH